MVTNNTISHWGNNDC